MDEHKPPEPALPPPLLGLPPPLLGLPPARLAELAAGCVLVPSRRLQQSLQETWDRNALAAGRISWTTPDVVTPEEVLLTLYDDAVATGHAPARRLLSGESLRIAAIGAGAPPALYPLLEDAWTLLHDFGIDVSLPAFGDHEGSRLLRDWAVAFEALAAARGWITTAELAAALANACDAGWRPPQILFVVGFEHIAPALRRLLGHFVESGARIVEMPLDAGYGAVPARAAFATPDEELQAALQWALQRARAAPHGARIGIVVPDLAQRYDAVLRKLERMFASDAPRRLRFDLSGGLPLGALPVCADALDLIRWCVETTTPGNAGRMLASPFLSLDAGEGAARSAALPARYDLARFAEVTGHRRAGVVAAGTIRWQDRHTLDVWMTEFREVLRLAGWPNRADLGSESFQAARRFERLIDAVAEAGPLVDSCGAPAALAHLVAGAERTFAPERGAATVHVLGYLESVGCRFSNLWVTGLTDRAWPGTVRTNPLVPRRLLIEARVPRCTPDDELAFARRLVGGWCAAAPEVVFSHPEEADGERCRPSALLPHGNDYTPATPAERSQAQSTSHIARIPAAPDTARPIEASSAVGAGTLVDQSLCPFRAFAIHRLHVPDEPGPRSFPGAAERGTALHRALQLTYRNVAARDELLGWDEPERRSRAHAAASAALRRWHGRFPGAFVAAETERVTGLVLAWLALDVQRPPFLIETTEASFVAEIATVLIHVRVDRVDRDAADGRRMLMDYKTGRVTTRHWRGERPADPQLPLYSTVVPEVDAVAFAEVREAACALTGVTASPAVWEPRVGGIRMEGPEFFDAPDWHELLRRWRSAVTALAVEHQRGDARVDPLDASVCARCHLHRLCRIGKESGAVDG